MHSPCVTELRNECSICGGCRCVSVVCYCSTSSGMDTHGDFVVRKKKIMGVSNNSPCVPRYSLSQKEMSVQSVTVHCTQSMSQMSVVQYTVFEKFPCNYNIYHFIK